MPPLKAAYPRRSLPESDDKMKLSRPLTLLLALGVSVGTAACGPPAFIMANPVTSGHVAENTVLFRDRTTEMQAGVNPATFNHEASLTSATDKEICFNVKIRTPRKDLASPKGWRVFLRGKPTFEDMSAVVKSVAPVEEEVVSGSVLLSSHQNQQVCDNTGYCYNKEITTSTRVPQDVKVLTGGGVVCFANGGHLTGTTEEVTLHFDDPSPPMAGLWTGLLGRVAFRWKFN
jgi:hypothetical protein